MPLVGTIFFFLIGSTKLSKKRRLEQKYITQTAKRLSENLTSEGHTAVVAEPYAHKAKLAESLTGLVPTKNNSVEVLSGYDELIQDMTMAVNRAKEYVYVEFFAMALDATTEQFFEAMERAVNRGVKVYVLFDFLGSRKYPGYHIMKVRLTEIGVKWRTILPINLRPSKYNRPDLRNHRKIVVVDNSEAYTGSLNMIEKTYHRKDTISYIELAVHLKGPAVNELAAVFAGDWLHETGQTLNHFLTNAIQPTKGNKAVQIVPSGPGYNHENNLKFFVALIQGARSSVTITNPYLVPDESLLGALISAALRGVKVSILNSQAIDQWMVGHAQRSYYDELMTTGVTISLYKKPQLVHEKFIVIDNETSVVGSSNLDIRSFELNHECVVAIYDKQVSKKLAGHHQELLKNSEKLHIKKWRKRSRWHSFLDSMARLTSALQ